MVNIKSPAIWFPSPCYPRGQAIIFPHILSARLHCVTSIRNEVYRYVKYNMVHVFILCVYLAMDIVCHREAMGKGNFWLKIGTGSHLFPHPVTPLAPDQQTNLHLSVTR